VIRSPCLFHISAYLKLLITEIPWDDDNNLNGFYQVVGGRCLVNLVSNSISGRLRLSYLNIAYFPTAACRVTQCVPVCVVIVIVLVSSWQRQGLEGLVGLTRGELVTYAVTQPITA